MQECRSLAPMGPVSNHKWMDPQDAGPLYQTGVGKMARGGVTPTCQRFWIHLD